MGGLGWVIVVGGPGGECGGCHETAGAEGGVQKLHARHLQRGQFAAGALMHQLKQAS